MQNPRKGENLANSSNWKNPLHLKQSNEELALQVTVKKSESHLNLQKDGTIWITTSTKKPPVAK